MADVDIFVGNNTIIDPEVYQLWLNGFTAQEAATIQQKRGVLQQYGATFDVLLSDTLDHYRTFGMIERLLQHPSRMGDQSVFQITHDTQRMLIERYYEFDAAVVREILGKKLSSRNRNALDDVSDKTKVQLRSCRRQFDNVKRVFKVVEEMMGSLVNNITSHFLLPKHLAEQYSAIVFITNNRFETGKKKLGYLVFNDFVICANEMIRNWSYSSKDCRDHEDMDVDLDREFLLGLRELKFLTDKDHLDEHRTLVLQSVQGRLTPAAMYDLENNFKTLAKNLIHIAHNLNQSKELKDLFLDLVERFIEPCRCANWAKNDVQLFLEAYRDASLYCDAVKRSSLQKTWERYLVTITKCILQMYHT